MAIIKHADGRVHAAKEGIAVFRCVLIAGIGMTGGLLSLSVSAQDTTARIFGHAPAGTTVMAESSTGVRRHVAVDAGGDYSLRNLPLSVYTVSLQKGSKTIDTRANVSLWSQNRVIDGRPRAPSTTAEHGVEVDFPCPNGRCAAASGG
ncbi:MAG TPA: carboxypeptidase-like regulatory domain-containing protein [Rhodanobacter sp.]